MSAEDYAQAVGAVRRDPRYIELDALRAHWWKVYREADAAQDRARANEAHDKAAEYKRQADAMMDAVVREYR